MAASRQFAAWWWAITKARRRTQGFYLQNLPADADGDPATSDAIFVYNGASDSVSLGEIVQVTGTVSEYQNQTQLSNPVIANCDATGSVDPVDIDMPFASADALERFEACWCGFRRRCS